MLMIITSIMSLFALIMQNISMWSILIMVVALQMATRIKDFEEIKRIKIDAVLFSLGSITGAMEKQFTTIESIVISLIAVIIFFSSLMTWIRIQKNKNEETSK